MKYKNIIKYVVIFILSLDRISIFPVSAIFTLPSSKSGAELPLAAKATQLVELLINTFVLLAIFYKKHIINWGDKNVNYNF